MGDVAVRVAADFLPNEKKEDTADWAGLLLLRGVVTLVGVFCGSLGDEARREAGVMATRAAEARAG